jgi:hypothetical protein
LLTRILASALEKSIVPTVTRVAWKMIAISVPAFWLETGTGLPAGTHPGRDEPLPKSPAGSGMPPGTA